MNNRKTIIKYDVPRTLQKVYNVGFRVVVEDVADKDFVLNPELVTPVPSKFVPPSVKKKAK